MSKETRIAALNTVSNLIAELRVARALINDQVRGTNDPKYDLVKQWDDLLPEAQRVYDYFRRELP